MSADNEAGTDRSFLNKAMDVTIHVGLVLVIVVWSFQIAKPFLAPIIWGAIIAIGSYPLVVWMSKYMGGRLGRASLVFTLLALVLLIWPSVKLGGAGIENAQLLGTQLKEGTLDVPAPRESVKEWPLVGDKIYAFWSLASDNLEAAVAQARPQLTALAKWLLAAGAGLSLGILQFAFSIIIAGFFIAKSSGARDSMIRIASRLAGKGRGQRLVSLSHDTVQSVVRGILGIAVIQAVLAAMGFVAMGIPAAGLWAGICLVLAVVQIDILIILIPMSIYMFSVASTGAATLFLIWCIFVGLINNVLKPILLGRGVEAPMVVVFVGAIGGLMAQGVVGLFVGPVVLVLGYTLFKAWLDEQSDNEDGGSDTAAVEQR